MCVCERRRSRDEKQRWYQKLWMTTGKDSTQATEQHQEQQLPHKQLDFVFESSVPSFGENASTPRLPLWTSQRGRSSADESIKWPSDKENNVRKRVTVPRKKSATSKEGDTDTKSMTESFAKCTSDTSTADAPHPAETMDGASEVRFEEKDVETVSWFNCSWRTGGWRLLARHDEQTARQKESNANEIEPWTTATQEEETQKHQRAKWANWVRKKFRVKTKYSFGFGKPALENIRERLVHFKVTLHEWRRRVETNEQAWCSSRVRDAYKDLIQAYDEKLDALWLQFEAMQEIAAADIEFRKHRQEIEHIMGVPE